MHSLVDVVCAALLFLLLRRYDVLWRALLHAVEAVANSWREWRIGSLRLINHGVYTGIGAALGYWLIVWLAGPEFRWPFLAITVFSMVSAALWAQAVEGSSILLRPLGYYGGVVGGLAGIGLLALLGRDVMVLLGASAVGLPWVQAFGRIRCLVQGCCHGGPAEPGKGIRYWHSRSRVTQIAGLTGVPLYPTPLYSILSNVGSGILLLRLWTLHASVSLVLGLYFILNALARFIEEAYRAEPQTPVIARLRLYQWLALAGFLLGVLFTLLPSSNQPTPQSPVNPGLLLGALLLGVFVYFLTGVDFPESNRRFSRLASAEAAPRLLGPRTRPSPDATPRPQHQVV
jgi:prolipoprotein diacylglyceryltransferase